MAELLFLSPLSVEEEASKKTGSRISKRLLKQQKEKEAERLLEGTLDSVGFRLIKFQVT